MAFTAAPSPSVPTAGGSNNKKNKNEQNSSAAPLAGITFWESYWLGGFSATASRTAIAPIDRIKLLLQCEGELIRQGKLAKEDAYKGMLDCAKKTIAVDGGSALCLWRGNLSTVVRYFPTKGMNFALKGTFKSFDLDRKENGFFLWFWANVIAGGLSGVITLSLVNGFDYTRTRMALDIQSTTPRKTNSKPLANPEHQFKNLRDCIVQTVQCDGIIGLYRGFWLAMITTFIKQGFYFGIFDALRPLLPPSYHIATSGRQAASSDFLRQAQEAEAANTFVGRFYSFMPTFVVSGAVFMLGWFATFTANVLSHPFDTVRRRVMATTCVPQKYNGSFDCYLKVTKAEGFRALWKGVGASAVYSVAGGVSLMLFDLAKPMYVKAKYGN